MDSSSVLSLERPSLLLRDKSTLFFLEGGLFEYKRMIVIFSIYSEYCSGIEMKQCRSSSEQYGSH